MLTEKKKATNKKWNEKNSKLYSVRIMYKTDSEIIELLERIPEKSKYIKALLRADLDKLQAAPGEAVCEKFINRNAPGPDPAGPEKSEMD